MKQFYKKTKSLIGVNKSSLMKMSHVLYFVISLGGLSAKAQLVNIPVTGFNNDIVANGVGSNSVSGLTNNQIGVDGAKYYFIDNTFKYSSSSSLPTCYMPTSHSVPSSRTSGLTYTLQSYSANNSLTLDNNLPTYPGSPYPNKGTLILTAPASYTKLFVLYESVVNVAPLTVDVLVTFTDSTTQAFNSNTCVNWFTATQPTFTGVGRGTPTGVIQCGAQPNLFELQLSLLAANYGKQVANISITIPTTLSTGSFAYNVNYFHAMALGGQTAPTGVKSISSEAAVAVYPNPANDKISVEVENPVNTFFILMDITGRVLEKITLEKSKQSIALGQRESGIYFYEILNDNKSIYTGKLILNN